MSTPVLEDQPRAVVAPVARPRGDVPTVAVVGCGAAAQAYHLPALARHPEVLARLVLVERDAARREALTAQYGCRGVETLDAVIDEIDAAIVAAPHEWHHPLTLQCVRAGVPVLCEKPLAGSAEGAREIAAEAERRDVIVAVNHTRRLIPSFARLRALLRDGAIGRPQRLEIRWGEIFGWPAATGAYFQGGDGPRGVLLDLGAHAVDLACWWLDGEPAVLAYRDDARGGAPAVCAIEMEIAGTGVDIRLSWLSQLENRIVVRGDRGTIECGLYDFDTLTVERDGRRERVRTERAPARYEGFAEPLVDNFLRAIAGLERPLVSAADVVPSLAAMDACAAVREPFALPWHDAHRRLGDAP